MKLILNHVYFVTLANNLLRFTLLALLGPILEPFIGFAQKKYIQYTRDKVNA
jgi:hypothetical protein